MRVITNLKDFEVWQSAIRGLIVIKRFDRKGDPINEAIPAGKTIHITPEERRFNQEIAAEPTLDVFSNGMLVPVKLLDGTEDAEELKDNPNHLTETAMRSLFADKRSRKALEETVSRVSNPITLQRMLALADEEDATVKQVSFIQDRLAEVTGTSTQVQEVETISGPSGHQATRTSAPESPAPRNPGVGRR